MQNDIEKLSKLIRYYSLTSTTEARSGHPTSSLSATDLMSVLFFGGYFKYDIKNPRFIYNDRLIFSKGHASPLFYSVWMAAGGIKAEEMSTLRKFGSRLEGHPTPEFPYTEVTTGSLGQGLSIGCGYALNAKSLDKLPYKTFVLLGDGEMAEGSNWEAAAFADHYTLNNLIAIIDVNRLGQSGETMTAWNTDILVHRFKSFGWNAVTVDGHTTDEIKKAYEEALASDKPFAIIAKTIKGKGISMLENKENWHGKPLKPDQLQEALKDLGDVDLNIRGTLKMPETIPSVSPTEVEGYDVQFTQYKPEDIIATRKAYGTGLVALGKANQTIISLDGETKNSTYAETFMTAFPERFFESFIAEQNMVGVALGLSKCGKIPFVSTFAAFFSRAFDQIRMAQYSNGNVKFVGSHCGVSIGEDGASQMGLEDISMFSSLLNSTVLYPSDAISTEKLIQEASLHDGIVYIRTTRKDTPILYSADEKFSVGGSKTLRKTDTDVITIIAAGITVHESLKAYDELKKEGILIRLVDLYSIKPIDVKTVEACNSQTEAIIVVEDHYPHGGIGDAVLNTLATVQNKKPVYKMSVTKIPHSGTPQELIDFEEISASSIVKKVKEIIKNI